jgi:hypothetical protein
MNNILEATETVGELKSLPHLAETPELQRAQEGVDHMVNAVIGIFTNWGLQLELDPSVASEEGTPVHV